MKYYDLTAHQLHEMLIKKQVTSEEVTKAVIERADETETLVDSFITRTADLALETARAVDKKIANGEDIQPLEGIPTAFKDNFCTKGVKTTCASKMLEGFVPSYDAFAVQKLKQNNCPMLGKLNMDEFAVGSTTESSYFKKTKNPYDTDRVPGGSSGGAAAAVSAGSAVFALGSDTGGSIRQPASFCGVVGIKPTYGLVSRSGCVGLASSLDHVGIIAKDVTDGAHILNAVAGYDSGDSTSVNSAKVDYTQALVGDMRGVRVGIALDFLEGNINGEVKSAVLRAAGAFEQMGAQVSQCFLLPAKQSLAAYYIISAAEASANLARFDGIRFGYRSESFESLDELYENTRGEGFGTDVKRRILTGTYALTAERYDKYFTKAQKIRTLICNDFDSQFSKFDIIITPTTATAAYEFGKNSGNAAELSLSDMCTVPANLAGLPALSLPCGFDADGLPIGLQIIGKAFNEASVIGAAYAFEQSASYHKNRAVINKKAGANK